MSSKKNTVLYQKSIVIGLIGLGFVFIAISFVPDLLGIGKKGFGYTEYFFMRNALIFITAGLTLLFFPGLVSYFKNTSNNNEYQLVRKKDLPGWSSFSKYDFILLLLFLIASNYFAIHIVGKQNYIFNWDSAIFADTYAKISTIFKDNPLNAILKTLVSIQYDHYNLLAPFLLAPFSLLFGVERLPYILSMVNIFLFLSAVSFLLLYKRTTGMLHSGRLPLSANVVALFTFYSFTFIWIPLLNGQVGIGGFFIICLILFTYFKYPFAAQRYRTLVLLGILLTTLIIFRQYYIFWSASFFIALIINEFIFLFTEYRFDRERLVLLSKKMLFTIFISGLFFVMLAEPFLTKIVFGDYSYITIYKFSAGAFHDFKRFLGHLGFLYITLTLLGIFVSFYYKKTRKMASFLLIQWVATFFLFTRVQSFFPHHYYVLLPTMILFISLFMAAVLLNAKSRTLRIVICIAYILISSLTFSAVFSPEVSLYTKHASVLFPNNRYTPPVRNDIPEIKRMLNVIKSLLTDPDDRLYVLAGSERLNSDIIAKARLSLPDTPDLGNHIFRSSDQDLKDGFPTTLFLARYVLIADPIQHEFRPEQTRVINIPAESILKGENMGKSYRKLPYEFTLEKDVKAYIYERIGPINQSDVGFLSDALRNHYPDKPFVYKP